MKLWRTPYLSLSCIKIKFAYLFPTPLCLEGFLIKTKKRCFAPSFLFYGHTHKVERSEVQLPTTSPAPFEPCHRVNGFFGNRKLHFRALHFAGMSINNVKMEKNFNCHFYEKAL